MVESRYLSLHNAPSQIFQWVLNRYVIWYVKGISAKVNKKESQYQIFVVHLSLLSKKKLREILNLQIYASLLLQKIAEPSIRESLLPKFSILLPRKSIFNQISTGKRALKVITILIEIFLSRIRSILNSYSVQSQQQKHQNKV